MVRALPRPRIGSALDRAVAVAVAVVVGASLLAGCGSRVETLRVMTFNLWVGGESGGQPLEQTAQVIRAARADAVGLQETRGEERGGVRQDAGRKLASMLGWSYVNQGGGTGILTRLEVIGASPNRWGARLRLPSGREAWLFNAHLAHAPYQPYQLLKIPYGDGAFIATAAEAVAQAREARGEQVGRLLEDMEPALRGGAVVFLTGDLNEPSHLDWTAAAVAAGRCPIAVEWPTTRALADAGLEDAYRRVHPDALRAPGITWTPTTPEDDPRDRHDRIDFVLAAGRGWRAATAEVVGERPDRADIVVAPYPSDHRAVVVSFELAE